MPDNWVESMEAFVALDTKLDLLQADRLTTQSITVIILRAMRQGIFYEFVVKLS